MKVKVEATAPIAAPIVAPTGVEPKKANVNPASNDKKKGRNIDLNHNVGTEFWKTWKSQW